MTINAIAADMSQLASSTSATAQKKWTQIKKFVNENRKEVLVAMLIVGIAILGLSVGGSIAIAYNCTLAKKTIMTQFPWDPTSCLTKGGHILIKSLISAIFGAAMSSFAAGALLASEE